MFLGNIFLGLGIAIFKFAGLGTLFTGFGCSLYQTPNVGTAPYDSLSIIIHKKFPQISYFWERIFTDAVCALICFLAGGIVGLGTSDAVRLYLRYVMLLPIGFHAYASKSFHKHVFKRDLHIEQ